MVNALNSDYDNAYNFVNKERYKCRIYIIFQKGDY